MTKVRLSLHNNFFNIVIKEILTTTKDLLWRRKDFQSYWPLLGTKNFFSSLFSCHFFLASKSKWHEEEWQTWWHHHHHLRVKSFLFIVSSLTGNRSWETSHFLLPQVIIVFIAFFFFFFDSSSLTVKNRHETNKKTYTSMSIRYELRRALFYEFLE